MQPIDYLSICLDPVRLHALGAAAADRVTVEGVADAMGVPLRDARRAVGSLRAAGLVDASWRRATGSVAMLAAAPGFALVAVVGSGTASSQRRDLVPVRAEHAKRVLLPLGIGGLVDVAKQRDDLLADGHEISTGLFRKVPNVGERVGEARDLIRDGVHLQELARVD